MTSTPAWMNNITQTQSSAFSSFQSVSKLAATTQNDLRAWAQSSNGTYTYLNDSSSLYYTADREAILA